MVKLPKLYKKTNNKKVEEWEVGVSDGKIPIITVEWGYSDGQKQIKETQIKQGKNIGRANQTTPYEQACSEAQSKWNKQKDKGYSESLNERVFRPMLAKSFDKDGSKIKFPAYSSYKMDGVRLCISLQGKKLRYNSRNNKPFKVLPDILDTYLQFLPEGIILDGEIMAGKSDFQKVISAIKRDKPSSDSQLAEFHIFDMYDYNQPNLKFTDRLDWLDKNVVVSDKIKLVDQILTTDEEHMMRLHSKFVAEGYEGLMVRNKDSLYEVDKRSFGLQKVKTFKEEDFQIIDVEEDKNGEAVFICLTEEGLEFRCKIEGTSEERQSYLDGNFIDKMLSIKFFEYTNDGIPRFPVGRAVRDYE